MDPIEFTPADRRFLRSLRISPDDAPPPQPPLLSDELMRQGSVSLSDFVQDAFLGKQGGKRPKGLRKSK